MHLTSSVDGESGAAADTGSAMHAAIAEFHRKGSDIAAGLESMRARASEYPLANLQDAANMFLCYGADPRNKTAKCVLVEHEITFQIEPSPEDPTGEAIEVIGHLDQLREVGPILELWDPKSSRKDPAWLLKMHQHQLAAYCKGAEQLMGREVHPGGLILTRMYEKGRNPFFGAGFKREDIETILFPIRHHVAAIRRGQIWHVPNDNCEYCHFQTTDVCIPTLRTRLPMLNELRTRNEGIYVPEGVVVPPG